MTPNDRDRPLLTMTLSLVWSGLEKWSSKNTIMMLMMLVIYIL